MSRINDIEDDDFTEEIIMLLFPEAIEKRRHR